MGLDLTAYSPTYNATGKFSYSLNGGEGYRPNIIPSSGTFTVEGWLKTSTTGIIQVAVGAGGTFYIGCQSDNFIRLQYGNTTAQTIASTVNGTDGAWHHFEWDYDPAVGSKFFVDGALIGSNATTMSGAGATYANYFSVRDMGGASAGAGSYQWSGEIDEVAVWSTVQHTSAFTPRTSAISNAASGLIALYHLDNNLLDSTSAAATAVTLTGPSSGTVSVASTNFTVGADGTITGTVIVTPADAANGGTFTPTTVSISSGSPTGTFTYTPASTGVKTISVTNNGSLTNPSSISYTSNASANNAIDTTLMALSPYNWNTTSTTAKSVNAGAYFRTIFGGTACTLQFDMTGVTVASQFYYRIDGYGAWTRAVVAASVVLTIPTDTADWAAKGGSLLEFAIKSTDPSAERWATPAILVALTGIVIDTGKTLTLPPTKPITGLIFGDSITEAQASVNNTDASFLIRADSTLGYAYAMRDLLNAEIGLVGFGGQGFSVVGGGNVPIFGTAYSSLYSGVSRSLTPAPDFILINQGQNDGATNIVAAATSVFNALIAATPKTTKIIVLRPFSGNQSANIQSAIAATTTPSRITYIDTTGFFNTTNSSDGIHPYGNEHITHIGPLVANAVRPLVQPVKGTRSAKTVTVTFEDHSAVLRANLTGLKWNWFDQTTPDALTVAADSGTGATTNASGVFSITVYTTLASAAVGWLEVSNSDGTTTQSGQIAFSGPVAVT